MPRTLKDWYTFAGAAAVVNVDPAVITRAVAAGRLTATATADGKARLIHSADLKAWKSTASAGRPNNN